MKLKTGFLLHQVCDTFIVFSADGQMLDYSSMIRLNQTGAFLWNCLAEKEHTKQSLIETLLNHYDTDEATATADVNEFIQFLEDNHLLQ